MGSEVFVHVVRSQNGKLKGGQHALFVGPKMTLLEEATEFLYHIERGTSSVATVRNNAFALRYWYNFCLGSNEDWRHSSLDDLIDYRVALETTISRQTRRYRTASTVEQYLLAVVEFYDYARSKRWYSGDIRKKEIAHHTPSTQSLLSRTTTKGAAPSKRVSPVRKRRDDSGTIIKPLAIKELRALLDAIGPSPSDAGPGSCVRDRLMVDWAWATGLRVSELIFLEVRQFKRRSFDDDAIWSHVPISIMGKGNKRRRISVPMWLIHETLLYINGERKRCVSKVPQADRPTRLFVAKWVSSRAGQPIAVRRIEAMLASAYRQAGLTELVEEIDPDTRRRAIVEKPAHCVHDLRHTYAVLTYHAEVANGNSEPWKKIQSQLGHASLATTTGIYLEYVNAHNEFRNASVRDLIGLARR